MLYYNVNEEDQPYQVNTSLEAAEEVLKQYPNDTIVIVTPNSPAQKHLAAELERMNNPSLQNSKVFHVEVQPALTYTLDIAASGPAHAAYLADREPMPSASEMQIIDGWVYIVEDPESGERLFDSEEGGMPDSEEEALSWDEDDD